MAETTRVTELALPTTYDLEALYQVLRLLEPMPSSVDMCFERLGTPGERLAFRHAGYELAFAWSESGWTSTCVRRNARGEETWRIEGPAPPLTEIRMMLRAVYAGHDGRSLR